MTLKRWMTWIIIQDSVGRFEQNEIKCELVQEREKSVGKYVSKKTINVSRLIQLDRTMFV